MEPAYLLGAEAEDEISCAFHIGTGMHDAIHSAHQALPSHCSSTLAHGAHRPHMPSRMLKSQLRALNFDTPMHLEESLPYGQQFVLSRNCPASVSATARLGAMNAQAPSAVELQLV